MRRISGCMLLVLLCASPALPQKQTYLGLDRNDYPGDANMAAALRRGVYFTGYWLNNPPGAKRNTWQGRRRALQKMGYNGFLLLFNGREYAALRASGNAARIGANDASAALQAAAREGFRKSSIIFLDQEQGGRMLPEQRAYIHAWVDGVTRAGYRAGIYCSGIPFHESDKISVVTAEDIREHADGREIHFFISNDQCGPSPGCVFPDPPPKPAESGVAFADVWQYAQSPRRPAMTATCSQSYARDGNCYLPGMMGPESGSYVDVDTATSPDPSETRGR